MHGLFRSAGSPAVVRLSIGLRLIPVTLRALGAVELFLLQRARHPAESIEMLQAAGLEIPDGIPISSLRDAYSVSTQELLEFLYCPQGVAFVVWYSLSREISYEELVTELSSDSEKCHRIAVQLSLAGGYDLLSESELPHSDGGQKSRPGTVWKVTLRDLSEAGISPGEFGDMTLFQFRAIGYDRKSLSGAVSVNQDVWRSWTPEQRREFIRSKQEGPHV